MLNCAELWLIRSEGTNPCRLVPMYPEKGRTHLLTDDEVRRIFSTLEKVERERTKRPVPFKEFRSPVKEFGALLKRPYPP